MGYKRQVIETLMVLLIGSAIQVALARSQSLDQQASSLHQQIQSGKIASSNVGTYLIRTARHASDKIEYIDLSHPLINETIHWPQNDGFNHTLNVNETRKNPRDGSYHLRSDSIRMAIHSGTHLDAPSHFGKDSWSVDKIPLERLIEVPLTVVDLSAKVRANRSYSFLVEDFQKDGKSLVKPESVVLVYTGISKDYDGGSQSYFGTKEITNITTMNSPGFSLEAAKYLVDQKVYGVGLDAVSADSSERQKVADRYDPVAHVQFNDNNIYILENVSKNLEKLIGKDSARLTINPLPITNGTGSPIRLVASLGHNDCDGHVSNGAMDQEHSLSSIILLLISTCILAIFV